MYGFRVMTQGCEKAWDSEYRVSGCMRVAGSLLCISVRVASRVGLLMGQKSGTRADLAALRPFAV